MVGRSFPYPTKNTSGLNWNVIANPGTSGEYVTEIFINNTFGNCTFTSSFSVSENINYQSDSQWIAFVNTTAPDSVEREFTNLINEYRDQFGSSIYLFTLSDFKAIPNHRAYQQPVINYIASDGSNWQYFINPGIPQQ